MAEWLGRFIAGAPEWLFTPMLIFVIIIVILFWWLEATAYAGIAWPFNRNSHLGERNHDKK